LGAVFFKKNQLPPNRITRHFFFFFFFFFSYLPYTLAFRTPIFDGIPRMYSLAQTNKINTDFFSTGQRDLACSMALFAGVGALSGAAFFGAFAAPAHLLSRVLRVTQDKPPLLAVLIGAGMLVPGVAAADAAAVAAARVARRGWSDALGHGPFFII
jgi:hypothetical protein